MSPSKRDQYLCVRCQNPVPEHLRDCVVCGADNECPNIRMARTQTERSALEGRVKDAEVSAAARRCSAILTEFGIAVTSSRAVVARSISLLQDLVQSENRLYVPFQRQVASGGRIPEQNDWDPGRVSVENMVLPNYSDRICFAALSLNGRGLTAYGAYTIVLKEEAIALRATVFEENPFTFAQKHKIITGEPVPPGYRALLARGGEDESGGGERGRGRGGGGGGGGRIFRASSVLAPSQKAVGAWRMETNAPGRVEQSGRARAGPRQEG